MSAIKTETSLQEKSTRLTTGFSEYKINLTQDLTAYCLFQIETSTKEISGLVFSIDRAVGIEDYVRAEQEIREHLKANAVSLITSPEDYVLNWV